MKKIFLLAAAVLSLTACEQNIDSPPAQPLGATITATIGESTLSRASDNSWDKDDKIGITAVVGQTDIPMINLEYSTEDGGYTFTGNPLYYYKGMKLNAYYPFTGEEGVAPGDNGVIAVSTTADMQEKDNLPKIDFLWDDEQDITLKNTTINFVFTHRMTKLSFTFKNGEKIDVKNLVCYQIEGLGLDGTFDTNTGECSLNSDATAQDLKIEFDRGTVEENVPLNPVILLPQKPIGTAGNPGSVILRLFLDESDDKTNLQTYSGVLNFGEEGLKAGYHYNITITVTKAGLKIDTMNIDNWINQDPIPVTSTID